MSLPPAAALDDPFLVTSEMRERFRRDGFIKIKNVVPPEALAAIEPAVTEQIEECRKTFPKLEDDGFYHKQFVQVSAIWKKSETIRSFTFSKRFARMAAELMGVQGVRLYHDQALYKLPGGSHTLHHQDLSYWPLDTENACALWIPLQAVPVEMGPLAFYAGSHRLPYKSEDLITPEGEAKMLAHLVDGGCAAVHEPYELGEVSFHAGWTCHTAKPNVSDRVRKVHTINFFEDGTRLADPTKNQAMDWKNFLRRTRRGQVIDNADHPVLWSAPAS